MGKRLRISSLVPFVLLFLLMLVEHHFVGVQNDDESMLSGLWGNSVIDIVMHRYRANGRYLTDGLAFLLLQLPFPVFRVINSAAFALLAWLLALYFGDVRSLVNNAVACLLVAMVPLAWLGSAGYVATSTNYLYTAIAALLAFMPLYRASVGKEVGIASYALSLPCMLYASNQEQTGIACLLVSLAVLLVSLRSRAGDSPAAQVTGADFRRCAVTIAIMWLAVELFAFLNPGHIERMTTKAEMEAFFNEYGSWTIFDKLRHGFTSTVAVLLYQSNRLFLAYSLVLLCVVSRRDNVPAIVSAATPLVVMFVAGCIGREYFVFFPSYGFGLPDIGTLGENGLRSLVSLALAVVATASSLVATVCYVRSGGKWFVLLFWVVAALMRGIMGFSATLFVSGMRTFFPSMVMYAAATLMLLRDMDGQGERRGFLAALLALAAT